MENKKLCQHFYEKVIVNYEKYIELQELAIIGHAELRTLGICLCRYLYHFKEEFPNSPILSKLNQRNPSFDLIHYICLITKHQTLNPKWHSNPSVDNENNIYEVLEVINLEDDEGDFQTCRAVVNVITTSGHNFYLIDLIIDVINMWFELLFEYKYLDISPDSITNVYLPCSRFNTIDPMNLVKQHKYCPKIKYYNYDYEKKELTPADTYLGKIINFSIRKSINGIIINVSVEDKILSAIFGKDKKTNLEYLLDVNSYNDFLKRQDNTWKLNYLKKYHTPISK